MKRNIKILYFNTVNEFKIIEIREIFKSCKIRISFLNNNITEILAADIHDVILAKAAEAYEICKVPVIVEHGALGINYLNGFPGALSKPMWDLLNDKICKLIPPGEDRSATAYSGVCFCDGQKRQVFIGETVGKISEGGRGTNGFQWDPIFIPDGSDKTHAEMDLFEKLKFSQAAKAYDKLRKAFHI